MNESVDKKGGRLNLGERYQETETVNEDKEEKRFLSLVHKF